MRCAYNLTKVGRPELRTRCLEFVGAELGTKVLAAWPVDLEFLLAWWLR